MKISFVTDPSVLRWRRYASFLSILCFLAACACPALYFQRVSGAGAFSIQSGLIALMWGWMGIVFWHTFAWLANPCYFVALICFIRWSRGTTLTFCSFALGFAVLTFELFSRSELYFMGGNLKLVGLGVGFYFWIASLLTLFFAALADTETGDAFFQHWLPRISIGNWSISCALLITLLLSLPAVTFGGWYLTAAYSSYREYEEYRRSHPIVVDRTATSEAIAKSKSVSIIGGSDRAIDWNQDGQLDLVYISVNLAGLKQGYYYWSGSMTAEEQPRKYPEEIIYSDEEEGLLDTSTPIALSIPASEMLKVDHNGIYRVHLQMVQNRDDPEKRTIFYVQGEYLTKPYNSRQFLPVDRSERPPVDSSK